MFIPEHYILSTELQKKYKISQSVFSMLKKSIDSNNIKNAMLKYGNCLFVNARSYDLPNNVRKMVQNGPYTRMDNKLVSTYIQNEFDCKKSQFIAGLKEYNAREVHIEGKSFIEFDISFKDKINGRVLTNINSEDLSDCLDNNEVDGFINIGPDNFLVWY